MLEQYASEFIALAIIHFLAVVAPGPDFTITIRQSITYGRTTGLITSLGIGAGISVHVIYTVLGVGLIVSQSDTVFFNSKNYWCNLFDVSRDKPYQDKEKYHKY